MDKYPSRNGFHKDVSLSESSVGADDSKNLCYSNNSEIGDSRLINQSIIISGSFNINHGIHDISNYAITNDELNTNIDALLLDKKDNFLESNNDVDLLSGNVVETVKSHCKPGHNLLNSSDKSEFNKSKALNTVETPEVEITSREESNGKFRVQFHIKGFKTYKG